MNNDRFKFRVWDFPTDNNTSWENKYTYFDLMEMGDDEWSSINNQHQILEQCTGLRDKKGTLIYENDIVFYYGYEKPIEWHNGFYIVAGAGTMTKLVRDGMCEIIGNVHETKE